MKKKYFQEKTMKRCYRFYNYFMGLVQQDEPNFGGHKKVDGTPNGLDQGYVHAESSQALNIEKDFLDDDIGPSQGGSVRP